ncbi:MAG: phosphate acetyltransferase [Candidatus Sumerlaeaceae bacterium]|nr:phosphate acetyltransferase [Candidatus Sumerlaeaceae bacterium]
MPSPSAAATHVFGATKFGNPIQGGRGTLNMANQSELVRQKILAVAAKNRCRIVLPEAGTDARTLHAARGIKDQGIAEPILIGERAKIEALASAEKADMTGLIISDPAADASTLSALANSYRAKRAKENLTPDQARATVSDPLYFASMLVADGQADGMTAGAVTTTGDVLRASIKCIGLQPGIKTVSSHFVMVVPDSPLGENGVIIFADCAVMIDPNAEQMADIAIATADTAGKLLGMEPRIAMLSFSTRGSAQHARVDKVRQATEIVRKQRPDLKVDGELQADAALIESIGQRKAPDSPIAGKANILIFPDLDSGNIGYKLVQRLGKAEAIGPVLQGLAKSVNDLSRGCSVQDIIDVTAITAAKANLLR